MKKRNYLKISFVFLLLLVIVSCNKDKDKVKELAPAEAKVEVRSASQQITTNMDQVMNTPGMQSINYLGTIMGFETWKSTLKQLVFQTENLSLGKVKDAFRTNAFGSNREDGVGEYGVYVYNFQTGEFDLTETSTSMLKLFFPASAAAESNETNNGEFIADNLLYTTITYTDTYWDEYSQKWITDTYEEKVPTNIDLTLKVDNAVQATGNYSGSYSSNGTPTSINVSITMAPYTFVMGMSGSGTNYSTNLTFKQSGTELMGYDMDIAYSSNMETVDKISGYYHFSPLKVEGWANISAIDDHMTGVEEGTIANYDLDYLNSQISLKLFQTVLNATIGTLEFKMYTDPQYGDTYPMIAVIYSDGTFDWLENIMNDSSYKFGKHRK